MGKMGGEFCTRNAQDVPQRCCQYLDINLGEVIVSRGGDALEVYFVDPQQTRYTSMLDQ